MTWRDIIKPSGVAISLHEINVFEAKLGYKLPHEYKVFLAEINGGKLIRECSFLNTSPHINLRLNYLFPLTNKSPFIGVMESRNIEEKNIIGLRQMLRIGDDMGTGFFFIMLEGLKYGSIYFAYKDDLASDETDHWHEHVLSIPDYMIFVCQKFDNLLEGCE